MSAAAWTAIAAIGASLVTAGASLGIVAYQESRRARAADRDQLDRAVIELLQRAIGLSMRARTMAETMKVRSGLGEGLDVATRLRKPVDLFTFHDWMSSDWDPLNRAWSEIWARGDDELIQSANTLVDKCAVFLGVATARQPVESARERAKRWVVGDRWTAAMVEEHERAMKDMAAARRDFALVARSKLGRPAAALFSTDAEPRIGAELS